MQFHRKITLKTVSPWEDFPSQFNKPSSAGNLKPTILKVKKFRGDSQEQRLKVKYQTPGFTLRVNAKRVGA